MHAFISAIIHLKTLAYQRAYVIASCYFCHVIYIQIYLHKLNQKLYVTVGPCHV